MLDADTFITILIPTGFALSGDYCSAQCMHCRRQRTASLNDENRVCLQYPMKASPSQDSIDVRASRDLADSSGVDKRFSAARCESFR